MSITRSILAFVLFILLCWSCGSGQRTNGGDPLIYAELTTDDGWSLRINGDGSGTLSHRQYPLHQLYYPETTFFLPTALRIRQRCRTIGPSPLCYEITYFGASGNTEANCPCTNQGWPVSSMATAIRDMPLAVDDAGSERASRMLRREWLAAR